MSRPRKENPPRMTSGGNGKPFFWGYAGSEQLGRPFKAPQPVTLGLTGFGGASVRLPPILGWKKTMTPGDVTAYIAVLSRSGRLVQALKNLSVARSISSSSPLFSALRLALC